MEYRRASRAQLRQFANRSASFLSPNLQFDAFFFKYAFGVGTPSLDKFLVTLETGSNQFFVFDKSYPVSWPYQKLYDPDLSKSSVFVDDGFETKTGGGVFSGKTYQDKLDLIDYTWDQKFGSVTNGSGWGDGVFYYNGVFGFGWDPAKGTEPGPDAAPIVNMMRSVCKLDRVQYMFKEGQYAQLHFAPLPSDATYVPFIASALGVPVFNVNGFAFSNYAARSNTPAIVDSGYSVLALPSAQYRVLFDHIQPTFDWQSGLYVVDCGDLTPRPPKIVFDIGGMKIPVYYQYYVLDFDLDDEMCIFAVGHSAESDPLYHLGLPFLRAVMVIWDGGNNQMGFKRLTD